MNDESNKKLDKFLYLFNIDLLAKRCCCGCSLRTGVEIIAVITIIDSMIKLIHPAYSYFFITLIRFTSLLLSSIGSVYLFVSANSSNLDMAVKAYFLYVVNFYLDMLLVIASICLNFYDVYYVHYFTFVNALLHVIAYMMVLFFLIVLRVYFLWIVYSYTKYFSKGELDTLDQNNNEGYRRIENNPNQQQA
jgi:hypothetical protein